MMIITLWIGVALSVIVAALVVAQEYATAVPLAWSAGVFLGLSRKHW